MPFYYIENSLEKKSSLPVNLKLVTYADAIDDILAFYHHQHDVLEILYMKSGELNVTIDDNEYHLKPGDAVVINPYKIHSGKWSTKSVDGAYYCFNCGISQSLSFPLSELEECKKHLNQCTGGFCEYLPEKGDAARYLGSILDEIFQLRVHKTPAAECRRISYMYMLMAYLFENYYEEWGMENDVRDVDFIKSVSVYVNDNYADDISTSDVAKAMYMTTSRFCHLFLKNFGTSFMNYLCYFRIVRASEMKTDANTPLYDIASAVGFSDYSHFSKMFKKYIHISPSDYFGKRK